MHGIWSVPHVRLSRLSGLTPYVMQCTDHHDWVLRWLRPTHRKVVQLTTFSPGHDVQAAFCGVGRRPPGWLTLVPVWVAAHLMDEVDDDKVQAD